MTMPGFTAECAIGRSGSYRAHTRPAPGNLVMAQKGLRQMFVKGCYQNCINRCGGPISLDNLSHCIGVCLFLCERDPLIWF
jgi:hypothetical protein